MICRIWNWLKGLFVQEDIKQEQEHVQEFKMGTKKMENNVEKGTTAHQSIENSFVVKIEKGTLTRKHRRFIKRMGWQMFPARNKTSPLYTFINNLMNDKSMGICQKRQVFREAMGK